MALPLQITIRDFLQTEAIKTHIEKKAKSLTKFFNKIISFKIVVEQPKRHLHDGKLYSVSIDISVPHQEIVVNHVLNKDVYIAIRDAFNAAKRQVRDTRRQQMGFVKNHQEKSIAHGKITRIFPEEGFGFIETHDGREFYFNKDSVAHPDFNQLDVGVAVQFLEIIGDDGMQANQVSAGKHSPLELS